MAHGVFHLDSSLKLDYMITMQIIRSIECRYLQPLVAQLTDKTYKYLAVQYLVHGAMRLSIAGRRRIVRAPALWLAYPGARYVMEHYQGLSRRWFLALKGPIIERWSALGLCSRQVVTLERVDLIAERFALLAQLHGSDEVMHLQRATLLSEELLRYVQSLRGEVAKDSDWQQRLYNQLATYAEAPDVAQIARTMGMAESTCRRQFKAAMGMPLHQAWIIRRLERASAALLAEPHVSIAEIAQRFGFDDPAYFSRCFSKYMGTTATALRARTE